MNNLSEKTFVEAIEKIRIELGLTMSDIAGLIPGETKQNYWKKATGKTAIKLEFAKNLTKVLPVELIIRKGNLYVKNIKEEGNIEMNNYDLPNTKFEVVKELQDNFKIIRVYTTIHGREDNEIFTSQDDALKKYSACCPIPCYCLYDSNWNSFCENNLTKHTTIDSILKLFNEEFINNCELRMYEEVYNLTLRDKANILKECSYEIMFSNLKSGDCHLMGSLSEEDIDEEFDWLYGYGDTVEFLMDTIKNKTNYKVSIAENDDEQWDICKKELSCEQKKHILEENGYLIPLEHGDTLFLWK